MFAQSSGSAITRSLDRDILFKLPRDFNFAGKENSSSESINFSASDLTKSPRRKPLSLSENCSPIFTFMSPVTSPFSIWNPGSSLSLPEKSKLTHPDKQQSNPNESTFHFERSNLFTMGSTGSQKRGHSPSYNLLASENTISDDGKQTDITSHELRLQAAASSEACPGGANMSVFEHRGKGLQPEAASASVTLYTLHRGRPGTGEFDIAKVSESRTTSSKLFTVGSNTSPKKVSNPTRKSKPKK